MLGRSCVARSSGKITFDRWGMGSFSVEASLDYLLQDYSQDAGEKEEEKVGGDHGDWSGAASVSRPMQVLTWSKNFL